MGGVVRSKYVVCYQRIAGEKEIENLSLYRSLFLIGKRVFDIFISILVISTVLSWLIPLIAILIKLDSPGPAFFIQQRVGFLGKQFRCLKLRSMVVNQDSDSMQAVDNDPRTTRLGHFLRITGLDELPQFFNVLVGDMSIVGPRPFMIKDDVDFRKVISKYELRYFARPGITGMAQVKGYRGRTASFQSIFHRYQWDAYYIRNASPSLDFKILRLTVQQTIKSIFSFKRKNLAHLNVSEANLLLDNLG